MRSPSVASVLQKMRELKGGFGGRNVQCTASSCPRCVYASLCCAGACEGKRKAT